MTPVVSIPLGWGRLIVKPAWARPLFSERYRVVPTLVIWPLRFTWRGYRSVR